MATDTNVVVLTGRLTRDMENRSTNSGLTIGRFSLAVNRRVKEGDQYVEAVSFIECALFGKSAEALAQYMTKGKQVSVTGTLVQSRWEQDGQSRSRLEVNVDRVQFYGGSGSGDSVVLGDAPRQVGKPVSSGGGGYAPKGTGMPGPDQFGDDIPF
jgi:single-strand DNA-binding protein